MKTVRIMIKTYTEIQEFAQVLSEFANDFDLVQGRYIVNAKSTMGILSLDISKPLYLNIRDAGAQLPAILKALTPFLDEPEEKES